MSIMQQHEGIGLPYIVTSNPIALSEKTCSSVQSTDYGSAMEAVFKEIEECKEIVRKQRIQMGLHDAEKDKWRKEVWEITEAKIYALNLLRDRLADLPSPGLTVEKSFFSVLDDLEARFTLEVEFFGSRGMLERAATYKAKLSLVHEILGCFTSISGSAGKQPLNGEIPSIAKELLSTEALPSVFDSLSIVDLQAVSELALEAMERRPEAAYEWGVADRFARAVKASQPA